MVSGAPVVVNGEEKLNWKLFIRDAVALTNSCNILENKDALHYSMLMWLNGRAADL